MFESVKKILIEQLKLEDGVEVTPQSRIKADLGADSLDILQLLMTIEEKYNIRIPDAALAKFNTVQDVCDYLETLESK